MVPEFATWLAVLRRGPICRRWKCYVNFRRDTGAKPSWRHLFARIDPAAARSGAGQCSLAGWAAVPAAAIDSADALTVPLTTCRASPGRGTMIQIKIDPRQPLSNSPWAGRSSDGPPR